MRYSVITTNAMLRLQGVMCDKDPVRIHATSSCSGAVLYSPIFPI